MGHVSGMTPTAPGEQLLPRDALPTSLGLFSDILGGRGLEKKPLARTC